MKKIALYLFAAIGLISSLFALYSLFTISGSTMYGSTASVEAIPGPVGANIQYARLQQVGSSPSATPVAFTTLNNNNSPTPHTVGRTLPTQTTMKRMIIRNANLTLEVDNINKAIDKISNLANNSGGYVVSSNSNKDDDVGIYNTAQISIRIPAEGLKSLKSIKGISY